MPDVADDRVTTVCPVPIEEIKLVAKMWRHVEELFRKFDSGLLEDENEDGGGARGEEDAG